MIELRAFDEIDNFYFKIFINPFDYEIEEQDLNSCVIVHRIDKERQYLINRPFSELKYYFLGFNIASFN